MFNCHIFHVVSDLHKFLVLLICGICLAQGASAQEIVTINQKAIHTDGRLSIMINNTDISAYGPGNNVDQFILNVAGVSSVVLDVSSLEVGIGYEVNIGFPGIWTLYFTELPLVYIDPLETIEDEPRVPATLEVQDNEGEIVSSAIGIEYKGGWTQTLAKKSYRIEFWEDLERTDKKNVSLLDMRNDDDWNLEAMYNQPLRLRHMTGMDIWKDLHPLYYQDEEPDASNGPELRYVEVFVGGNYEGVFGLSERIDRKSLKLQKDSLDSGQLFKAYTWGASTFGNLPPYDNNMDIWGGYEQVYPDKIDWRDLYAWVQFVLESDEASFVEEWKNWMQQENTIDYFIFLNALKAKDNTGKNIYTAKYNSTSPFFYVPLDQDGIFGMDWNSNLDPNGGGILSNGLYNRLLDDCSEDGFSRSLMERWWALRADLLSHDNLMARVMNNHDELMRNGVYARESLAWTDYDYPTDGIAYIRSWLEDRLAYLDEEMNNLCISSTNETARAEAFYISPNPSNGMIYFPNPYDTTDKDIIVYDNLGRIVQQTIAGSSLNLSLLPAGAYVLKFQWNNRFLYTKVLLQP